MYRRERLYFTGFFRFNTSPNIKTRRKEKRERQKISERHKGQSQAGKDGTRRREQVRGKLYLGNLIISHLQSTSVDAPSLHHTTHCEDKASSAGQPVDFPLSLSQRGLACPYISSLDMQTLMAIHQLLHKPHTITLIISTRSFSTKKPWGKGILVRLLVESSPKARVGLAT